MEQKLTAQELLRIFHAYPDSCVKWHEHTYSGEEFWSNGLGASLRSMISDCKLILTPLSEITDEDAIEIYKMVFNPINGTKDILVRKTQGGVTQMYSKYADNGNLSNGFMGIYPEGLEIIYRDDNTLQNPDTYRALLMWDYLRSKGYDCGYGSIPSLLTAGIAITKNEGE